MVVRINTFAWALIWVSIPYVPVALLIGRYVDIAVLVSLHVVLGVLVVHATAVRPLGAEPENAPHLTLIHPHGVVCHGLFAICIGYRAWAKSRLEAFGAPHFIVAFPFDFFGRLVSVRVSSSSRASVNALMRLRKDILLYPGGFVEAARHSYHADVDGRRQPRRGPPRARVRLRGARRVRVRRAKDRVQPTGPLERAYLARQARHPRGRSFSVAVRGDADGCILPHHPVSRHSRADRRRRRAVARRVRRGAPRAPRAVQGTGRRPRRPRRAHQEGLRARKKKRVGFV
jgi:hypothetical protein